ncbi:MAG: hypothetical protein HYT80_10685 [Euryarchaeota archaeon]|nr:hypothetical protein [Euryarchaeota archaeon]
MRLNPTVLALVLVLPTAQATADGASLERETDTIGQSDGGLTILETLEFTVSDAARYNANATWVLWIVDTAPEPAARIYRGAVPTTVPDNRVNATAGAPTGHQAYAISVAGLGGASQNGDKLSLVLTYSLAGSTYKHRLASATPSVLVWAHPEAGQEPVAVGAPAFIPADDRYHSVITDAAAGTEFTVTFQTAAASPVRVIDKYVWGAGGLVVGLVLAWLAVRQGWLGSAKAKKFEKGGGMESKDMLEARRRTLMAALKDLEVAHEAKEVPDAAYAPLKEEYKAQAVRVLRSLEDKKEPPTR